MSICNACIVANSEGQGRYFLYRYKKSIIFAAKINIMEESKNKKWTKETAEAFFQKMIDDKKAIVECIKEGGDINKVADERGFEIARTL